MSAIPQLRIDDLHLRHPGLTSAVAQFLSEAAAVCWARYHAAPVVITIEREECQGVSRTVAFAVPGTKAMASHANEIDATESGAYGVSLAAVEDVSELVAVSRAETLTGADWYLAPAGSPSEDMESVIRLEVSGTGSGSLAEIKRRLREKVAQTKRGQSNLPAIAAVVGFQQLYVAISGVIAQP